MPKISRLNEIHQIASEKASEALSKLTDLKILVDMGETELRGSEKIRGIYDANEECTGLFTSIKGDISGGSLLLFSKKEALILSDLLARRASGTVHKISKLDQTILEEAANIVSNAYLNILGDNLQISFDQEPPVSHQGQFALLQGGLMNDFLKTASKAVVIKIKFSIQTLSINGYLILAFSPEQMDVLFSSV